MSSQSTLFDNRPVAYESLFLGELPYEPQPNEQDIGLSGLWRAHTIKDGRNGDALNDYLTTIPTTVTAILTEHDAHSRRGSNDGEAAFAFIDREKTLPIVADITSQVVGLWEKALYRNDQNPLIATSYDAKLLHKQSRDERLAHLLASKSLVVETAAAVIQVLPVWSDKPLKPTIPEQKSLSKVLANWGPKFLTEWMDGTILTTWLDQQDISEAEAADYHELFTPGLRKHFAAHNISDPLAALDRVDANLKLLTDEAIAEHLDWTTDEAKDIFTPGLRKHFAVFNIANPLAALERVDANLKLLTDEAIAEHLDWTTDEAKDIFTPGLRKHFAVSNMADPLAALKQVDANLKLLTDEAIAEHLGWTEDEAKDIFTPGLRKHFAVSNISDPLAALKKVDANLKLLTDDVIAEHLGDDWTVEKAKDIFTPGLRKRFAVNKIANPLEGVADYIKGNISYAGRQFTDTRLT